MSSLKILLTLISILLIKEAISQDSTITKFNIPASDSNKVIHIRDINVSGNKKTKNYIIFREIHFKAGDTILFKDLSKQLELVRDQIHNTNLFFKVSVKA